MIKFNILLGIFIICQFGCLESDVSQSDCSVGQLTIKIRNKDITCERLTNREPFEDKKEYLQISDSSKGYTYRMSLVNKKGLTGSKLFKSIILDEISVWYADFTVYDTILATIEGREWRIISYSDNKSNKQFVDAYTNSESVTDGWIKLSSFSQDFERAKLSGQIVEFLRSIQLVER